MSRIVQDRGFHVSLRHIWTQLERLQSVQEIGLPAFVGLRRCLNFLVPASHCGEFRSLHPVQVISDLPHFLRFGVLAIWVEVVVLPFVSCLTVLIESPLSAGPHPRHKLAALLDMYLHVVLDTLSRGLTGV